MKRLDGKLPDMEYNALIFLTHNFSDVQSIVDYVYTYADQVDIMLWYHPV